MSSEKGETWTSLFLTAQLTNIPRACWMSYEPSASRIGAANDITNTKTTVNVVTKTGSEMSDG